MRFSGKVAVITAAASGIGAAAAARLAREGAHVYLSDIDGEGLARQAVSLSDVSGQIGALRPFRPKGILMKIQAVIARGRFGRQRTQQA
jgi:NAD(P)-dependent dehydrogenase (short-subunit alcohol dehydrogenase family)